ncbi:hypothetical protein KO481_38690 [Nocardia sp. NEAU-G5]|uniref:Outer membrane channel protein CpnT-like N-terminal domain-containing protein n=1 Tax=Nocardia albiluteola TaxID=2842303 RepID=A0ABS6BE35_9NOCA|nr:hypothetical protein [Nocardia albiluteola]MBU3067439.1 hypothetical protein [Nocardia albiluteola]
MGLYLPPELRWLGYVAGGEWPDGDEDAIWDVSGYWKDAAKALREIDSDIQTAKSQAVSAYPEGSGSDGVSKMFDQLLSGDQSLDQLADYMDSLGDAAFNMGTQVQAAKLMVIISLIALAIEIAWAWLFPPTAPAQEAASIGITQVVVRFLARMIGERILSQVAKFLGEKFISLASKFVLEILKSALISGGVDAAVQLGQMADGKRKNFDVKEFGTALAGGALGGAGGKMFGDWFGKQAGKIFQDMSNPWIRTGKGILVGAAGGEFGNVATNVAGGLITGDWSGFSNGAGWAGGAIHGGLGGGVRSYKDGPQFGGVKNFEVPNFTPEGGSWGSNKPYGLGEDIPNTTPAGYHGGSEEFGNNSPGAFKTPPVSNEQHTPNQEPVTVPGDNNGAPKSTNNPGEQGNSNSKSTTPAGGESPPAPKTTSTPTPTGNSDKSTPIGTSEDGNNSQKAPENSGVNNEKSTPTGNSGGNEQNYSSYDNSGGSKGGLSDGSGNQHAGLNSDGNNQHAAASSDGNNQPTTGITSGSGRSSSDSGFSASGNGDGTVQRPQLSINTDVPPVRDEPVSPLGPGEDGPLTGNESPVSPIDQANPWNKQSSPLPGGSPDSSPLSDPSTNRPVTPSSSSPLESNSSTPVGNSPTRASASSTGAGGNNEQSSPMSASSKGTPSTPSGPAAGSSSSVRSVPSGPPPSNRAPVSGLGDGSSTPSSSRPGALGDGSSTPSSSRPGALDNNQGGTVKPSATPGDGSGTPQSTPQTTGGGRSGSGASNDNPLPPYGSRPHDDATPHAGLDTGGLGGHHDGPGGISHDGTPGEPSWERNPDGSITVHLPDGTEVHVQDGFVFVGSHAGVDGGGPAAPHSYGRDGSVKFPRPDGSITVKPDGETVVSKSGAPTTKYLPDGTKVEFAPGAPTKVTTPDGTEHTVPTDQQGWQKHDEFGFTVTSHDGTEHTVDSEGNIVIHRPGDDHAIKVSPDGSVKFTDPHGDELGTPAGKAGKGAGQFGQQTFGRPHRVTHTVLPDGGGVRTTGPDGSTTTVKPDGSTEFKSPSGHTTTHDPEGGKVDFGPGEPTKVTHPDGSSHEVPSDKGSWDKDSGGDIRTSSPDGTTHLIKSDGGPIAVGRSGDDPHRFIVHRPSESEGSGHSPGTIGSIKGKFSDTFGSGNFSEHAVEFFGPDGKSVKVQVSSNGSVKATGSDGSTITVKKNGSAEFVSGDGEKTGFGSGGKESGSKENWVGNDATWSKQGDGVHMTAPDGTKITVDGEGDIHLSHPGDADHMVTVTKDHEITFGRPDGTGHTVHPDGSVRTKSPDGTETTVKHDGTTTFEENNGNTTLAKPNGTVVQHSPDGPTVVSGHDGTEQTMEPHGAVTVKEPDGTVHTINDAANPLGGRTTKYPDGSTTTVEKGPETPGLKDQLFGDHKPPSVGLNRPDGTELSVNDKGTVKVTDPNGTTYEKDSKGNVTVTRPGEEGGTGGEDKLPIETKGGTVKLSNGSTLENTSDGFKVFHDDSVSEVGKGGVKFTDQEGNTRTTRPDGMISSTKPDGSSRDTRSDGAVRDTHPDGTEEGSRPDGTTWTVDENGKVHVNEPDGTQRPPVDRLSEHLTGGQIVPVKSNWSRYEAPAQTPDPFEYQAPEAPIAEEWLAQDPQFQNGPPNINMPPPPNWPGGNWPGGNWPGGNWPPPWSHNWDHFPGVHTAGGGGSHHMPDLSALHNMANQAAAGLHGGPPGMSMPNLSPAQLSGLSNMANMPGLSNLRGLNGLSPQALSGLSNVPGLSGLSPSQLGGLSQFSPQQLSALSPAQQQTLAGLSPGRQQALAGLSPQQLAGMSPAQLAGLTGLTPAQQSALSPSQLGALSGLSPQQQSALSGMPASELAGLSPSQLSELRNMTPQQLAQLSHLSPQQLANALNAAQAQQGPPGLGNLAGLQQGLNGLTGTNGLSGLNDLSSLANSANPALTNALSGQNSMPSLGAQDLVNSLGHDGSGTAGGHGGGGSADSAGGQQDPAAEYGPDAAKGMAAVTRGGGGTSAAGGPGAGHASPDALQHNPAAQDQTPAAPSQGGGGSPGSAGGAQKPEGEGEGGGKPARKGAKKKTPPKKRAIPKSVLMMSPDEEIAPEEPEADVDVKFTMGGSAGAQARSGNKVTPEVVTKAPTTGDPPAD